MSVTSGARVAERQILIVGPYGVLGTGVVDAVAENPRWGITTAARRPTPTYRAQAAPPHIGVDLLDREGTTKAFSSLNKVTDLVFAAYVEKPTMAETVEPNARMLKNTLHALAARNVPLQRIVLAGGAKSYGFSLGTYAAMTRELGLPLRFPGTKEGWNTLQETTDAELFGRATLWALGEDKARNEIFNVSNGDVYRWRQLWDELAAFYDPPIAEPLAMSTVSEMSEKTPLWDSIVARYGLHATPYNQIANWSFVDWMLNFREETIQSTIKIRQAGFADCIDTHQSFKRQLTRLRDLRIIP